MKIFGLGCIGIIFFSVPTIAQEFPRFPTSIQDENKIDLEETPNFPALEDFRPTPLDPQPRISLPTPSVEVLKFRIQGNTVFSDNEILEALEIYVGQNIEEKDLGEIEAVVNGVYAEDGFLEVGAFVSNIELVPDQSNQAIITLQVLERVISDIQITGAGRLTPFIRRRLKKYINKPFNSKDFTNDFRFLLEQETIETIQGDTEPTDLANESLLKMDVVLGDIVELSATLNNKRSPSFGELERGLNFVHRNLAGIGDELNVQYRNTDGSNVAEVIYEVPVNADDGTISANAFFARSSLIQEPINEFDLDSETFRFGAFFRQPIIQTSDDSKTEEVSLGIGLYRNSIQESFSNIAFPLSAGTTVDGEFRSTVLNLFQEYSRKSRRTVLALRSDLDIGLPIGATNDPFFGDGSFVKGRLQGIFLYRLSNRAGLFSRWRGQIGDRTLASNEQYSIGSQNNGVRGSDASLSRDSGIFFSQEFRALLFPQLEIAPFFDIGYAGNQVQQVFQDNLTLASVGVALRGEVANRVFFTFEWAQPVLGRESFRDGSDFKFTLTGRIF